MRCIPLARWLALGVALAVLVGCDKTPKRYGVTGTVKYKGELVKLGSINFQADGGGSGGAQITDGKYEIPAAAGMLPGKYKVAISYPDPKFAAKASDVPGESTVGKDLLPAKFTDGSTLTADIKAEPNVVDFDLK